MLFFLFGMASMKLQNMASPLSFNLADLFAMQRSLPQPMSTISRWYSPAFATSSIRLSDKLQLVAVCQNHPAVAGGPLPSKPKMARLGPPANAGGSDKSSTS